VYWLWIAFPIKYKRNGLQQKDSALAVRFGKGSVVMKEPVISCCSAKRSLYIAAGLIITVVIVTSIILPKILFAGQRIVPLQATLETNLPENPLVPMQQTTSNSEQEEQLIASLMQDVDLFVDKKPEGKEDWELVRMRVTGYCPCSQCCGVFSDGITANNHHIQPGDAFVAADKRFKFGTEMVIPGYNSSKSVQVMDRGGAIKGDRLDLFFHTHQQALEWGVQYLDVLVNTK
jgi:3D (Asp-Asp-Asp) domain-containing protein